MPHQATDARGAQCDCEGGPVIGGIPAAGLFVPGTDAASTKLLLERLWRQRQASFLACSLTILQDCAELAEATGFAAAVETYRAAAAAERRAMMEHPCFRIWLGQIRRLPRLDRLGAAEHAVLRAMLVHLARLIDADIRRGPTVQRFDVDPLLMAAIPPSYRFDELGAKRSREALNPYSLSFAREVIDAALHCIGEVWPAARTDFDRFVKIIVHLPDLESRSCSAQRFAGAILLSSGDDTLLAVAESLVHECGHQILYCVMELDPLIRDDGRRSFTLPWSGAQRDAYGYFHATYIYLILALFFERVVDSGRANQADAEERLAAILAGLDRALGEFANADFFTGAGKAFFNCLGKQAVAVIERNRRRYAGVLQSGNRHGSQGNAADAEHAATAG